MKTASHTFASFPSFSKLTMSDKDAYESLIKDYPPLSDITFGGLMTWWNSLGTGKVSVLNNNLVVAYWIPGEEKASGLSLIGTNQVDESISSIFDYLKSKKEAARLVHVPEFVISAMKYPDLYLFHNEREWDECVLPVAKLASLEFMSSHKQAKVKRFLAKMPLNTAEVRSIDLTNLTNQRLLLQLADQWKSKGGINNIAQLDADSLAVAIKNSQRLGYENACLYIQNEIHSFILYQLPADPLYVIINYGRFSYDIPNMFEFAAYSYAQWFKEQGIRFANIDSDLGFASLRSLKLALGPANFFRKYTVVPK